MTDLHHVSRKLVYTIAPLRSVNDIFLFLAQPVFSLALSISSLVAHALSSYRFKIQRSSQHIWVLFFVNGVQQKNVIYYSTNFLNWTQVESEPHVGF